MAGEGLSVVVVGLGFGGSFPSIYLTIPTLRSRLRADERRCGDR